MPEPAESYFLDAEFPNGALTPTESAEIENVVTVTPTPRDPINIMICVLCKDRQVDFGLFQELMRIAVELPQKFSIGISIHCLYGDGFCRMRGNACCELLFAPGLRQFTHLLFLDSDIIPTLDDILKLANSGKDLIGGLYAKRQPGPSEYVLNHKLFGPQIPLRTGIHEVAKVGTGCMLISRKCLEAIMIALPFGSKRKRRRYYDASDAESKGFKREFYRYHWWFAPDDSPGQLRFDFFPMFAMHDAGTGRVRQLSEDWIFSNLAIYAGITPFVHTDVLLRHIGSYVYGELEARGK